MQARPSNLSNDGSDGGLVAAVVGSGGLVVGVGFTPRSSIRRLYESQDCGYMSTSRAPSGTGDCGGSSGDGEHCKASRMEREQQQQQDHRKSQEQLEREEGEEGSMCSTPSWPPRQSTIASRGGSGRGLVPEPQNSATVVVAASGGDVNMLCCADSGGGVSGVGASCNAEEMKEPTGLGAALEVHMDASDKPQEEMEQEGRDGDDGDAGSDSSGGSDDLRGDVLRSSRGVSAAGFWRGGDASSKTPTSKLSAAGVGGGGNGTRTATPASSASRDSQRIKAFTVAPAVVAAGTTASASQKQQAAGVFASDVHMASNGLGVEGEQQEEEVDDTSAQPVVVLPVGMDVRGSAASLTSHAMWGTSGGGGGGDSGAACRYGLQSIVSLRGQADNGVSSSSGSGELMIEEVCTPSAAAGYGCLLPSVSVPTLPTSTAAATAVAGPSTAGQVRALQESEIVAAPVDCPGWDDGAATATSAVVDAAAYSGRGSVRRVRKLIESSDSGSGTRGDKVASSISRWLAVLLLLLVLLPLGLVGVAQLHATSPRSQTAAIVRNGLPSAMAARCAHDVCLPCVVYQCASVPCVVVWCGRKPSWEVLALNGYCWHLLSLATVGIYSPFRRGLVRCAT
jgi:hypothetical protein